MIDYHQEILQLLNHHQITMKPSIELIKDSEEIAIATWKNFQKIPNESAVHFNEWYQQSGFNQAFECYKENTHFWEKVVEARSFDYQFLLDNNFKHDFPHIVEYFLQQDKLIKAAYTNGNVELFNLLKISNNEKEEVYKKFLIHYKGKIEKIRNKVKKYESDPIFLQELLMSHPSYYHHLSDEKKTDETYILLALQDKEILFMLNEELRKKYFPMWLEKHLDHINQGYSGGRHNNEEAVVIVQKEKKYLSVFLSENFKLHKLTALEWLEHDFDNAIKELNSHQLTKLFKEEDSANINKNEYERINQYLILFIEKFEKFNLDSEDNKILTLIKRHPILKEKVKNNIYLEALSLDGKISLHQLGDIVDFLVEALEHNKIGQDEFRKLTSNQYKRIDNMELIENKILPNERNKYIDDYLAKRHLNKKLTNDLPSNKTTAQFKL